MIWTKVCYSDECGEPCLSQQANARAELANVKRQLAITSRHLGEARAALAASSDERFARQVVMGYEAMT